MIILFPQKFRQKFVILERPKPTSMDEVPHSNGIAIWLSSWLTVTKCDAFCSLSWMTVYVILNLQSIKSNLYRRQVFFYARPRVDDVKRRYIFDTWLNHIQLQHGLPCLICYIHQFSNSHMVRKHATYVNYQLARLLKTVIFISYICTDGRCYQHPQDDCELKKNVIKF